MQLNGEADVVVVAYRGGPCSSTTGTLADQMKVPVFPPGQRHLAQGRGHHRGPPTRPMCMTCPSRARPTTRPVRCSDRLRRQCQQDPVRDRRLDDEGRRLYNAGNVPVVILPTCAADARWQRTRGHRRRRRRSPAHQTDRPSRKITTSITRAYNNGAEGPWAQVSPVNLIARQMVGSVNATGNNHADIGIMNPVVSATTCPTARTAPSVRPGGGHPALLATRWRRPSLPAVHRARRRPQMRLCPSAMRSKPRPHQGGPALILSKKRAQYERAWGTIEENSRRRTRPSRAPSSRSSRAA